MKLFERIQLVKVQSGQSRSGQAGSESCLPWGDRRKRSVDSENVGLRGFSSEIYVVADAEAFEPAEGSIRVTVRRGCQEPPESLARGTFSKGFSRNLGKPRSLLAAIFAEEVVGGRGQPETANEGL